MLSGSMFAGIAFAWARLGNIHAMSHPVSAYFHVAHGVQMRFFFQRLWNIMHLQIMDVMRRSTIISAKKKDPVIDFVPEMLVDEARDLLS